ncbi:hypothetical protein D3C71_1887210 [compost metagenome]
MILTECGLGKLQTNFESGLQQGFATCVIRFLVLLLEEIEVAVVIEDQELAFMFTSAEQIRAQAGATTYHLPELDPRFDGLSEYQVDHFRNVDAGVEHVYRNGDAEVVIRLLEFLD